MWWWGATFFFLDLAVAAAAAAAAAREAVTTVDATTEGRRVLGTGGFGAAGGAAVLDKGTLGLTARVAAGGRVPGATGGGLGAAAEGEATVGSTGASAGEPLAVDMLGLLFL